MTAWGPPGTSKESASPGTNVIALVTEKQEIATAIAAKLSTSSRLFLQRLRVDGTLFDPERLAKETLAEFSSIVCYGPDVPLDLAFATAAIVDRDHPDVSQIVITAPTGDVWREALRTGVRELVSPSALDDELDGALTRSAERAARLRDQRSVAPQVSTRGKVIVVLSPKGGSGKTMLTSNLAVALAMTNTGPVVLADFDVQFGDAASALGLSPEGTLGDLVQLDDIDATTLKVYLTAHEASGLFVLCGAPSPEDGELVTEAHVRRITQMLAKDFAYVVVDTAAGLDEAALAALDEASDIVLMTSLDVTSVRSLGKEIQALDRAGLLTVKRHFVLNRADSKVGIEVGDVEAALGMKADASIPSARAVPFTMNQGRPVVLESPNDKVAQEIIRFARSLAGAASARGAVSGEKGRGLPWRRKA